MKRTFAALAALAPALALAQATTWNIDPGHTQTGFTVRHLGITNVRGEFKDTAGTVRLDEKDPSRSLVEVTIEAATVNTRQDKRDAHLRSTDFFDVERFPKITFKSSKIVKAGAGYKVTGDLSMHGVTKPVVLEVAALTPAVKDHAGATRRGVSARGTINRQDFGLKWTKMVETVPVVGDEVKIEIEAELVKQAPEGTQSAQQGTPSVTTVKQPSMAR